MKKTSVKKRSMELKDIIICKSVGNLYWKNKKGEYCGCNNAFAEIIGLASPEAIVGKTDRDLFLASLGEAGVEATHKIDQQIMWEDQEKTLEEVGLDAEKHVAYYFTRKAPLKNKQGKVIGLIGTSINITKEKQALLAKQAFLENMSHDIRTPMAGVCGLSQLLYENYEQFNAKTTKEMLHDIKRSAETLLEFLDHILQVCTLGNDAVKKEIIDLNVLIDEVIQMLSPALQQTDLIMEVQCPSLFVHTDKFRLLRILLNILSNAIKFTPKGKIKISVDATAKNVIIDTEDTGIGIPEDRLEQIFEQFYKVRPSNQSAEFRGCGLGLYVVRLMLEDIGGKIQVESELNRGSKFSIVLQR